MKMKKEQFYKLYTNTITKLEYDNIIAETVDRFVEVVLLAFPTINKGKCWFDFDTVSDDRAGYFDILKYKEYISLGGIWILPEPYYSGCIPTEWLWKDDVEIINEVTSEIKSCTEKEDFEKYVTEQKFEVKKYKRL